jgi:membrane protease YdiL (CAAX protease family)
MDPTFVSRERPFPLWRSVAAVVGCALVLLFTITCGRFAMQLSGDAPHTGSLADSASQAGAYGGLALFLLLVLPRISHRSLARLFRVPTRAELVVALVACVASVAFDGGTNLVLTLLGTAHVQAGFEAYAPEGLGAQAAAIAVLVLAAPLAEELLFRGLILNVLAARMPFAIAAGATALVVGVLHGDAVLFPAIVASSVVFAYAYRRTDNLAVVFLAHACATAVGLFVP